MLNKLDQRLIDFFTMICWWTEVKLEKNNLYWAYKVNTLAHIFWLVGGAFLLVQFFEKGSNFWIVFISFCVLVSGVFFFLKVFFPDETMKHFYLVSFPQGSPNPCRVSSRHISDRKQFLFAPFVLVIGYYLQDISKFVEYEFGWGIAFFFASVFSCFFEYLMACDSIPPGEKAKRKARIQEWKGNLQPIQILGN